jgi:hypothetical protein
MSFIKLHAEAPALIHLHRLLSWKKNHLFVFLETHPQIHHRESVTTCAFHVGRFINKSSSPSRSNICGESAVALLVSSILRALGLMGEQDSEQQLPATTAAQLLLQMFV